MNNFTPFNRRDFQEIPLTIYDSKSTYYGGNQYWFPKLTHRLSGCGPVAAATITAYLSSYRPEEFNKLYSYKNPQNKADFIKHMVEVRKYVKPGVFGLTSANQFADNVLSFAKERHVFLKPYILDDATASKPIEQAITFISTALAKKLPVAILVLTHPAKSLREHTWHWMTITDMTLDPSTNIYSIVVSTYGERKVIDFNLLWNHRRPQDIIRLVYFDSSS